MPAWPDWPAGGRSYVLPFQVAKWYPGIAVLEHRRHSADQDRDISASTQYMPPMRSFAIRRTHKQCDTQILSKGRPRYEGGLFRLPPIVQS